MFRLPNDMIWRAYSE